MIPRLLVEPPMGADEAARWTTPEERAEAAAFGSERRRAEFLGWRAIVRRELGMHPTTQIPHQIIDSIQ